MYEPFSFTQSANCGKMGAAAGIEGALSGFANIIGAGPLISAIPGMNDTESAQQALQAAQKKLSDVTAKWQSAIENEKFKILQDESGLLQKMIQANQNQQAVIDETINEKVQTNSLMISMLTILVVFLIIYDLI
jgi:hypothetical protein